MRKGQCDRQPDEKPAELYAGGHDSNRPEPGRKAPNLPGKDKNKAQRRSEEHPEGSSVDKATPEPETRFGGKEIFEGERSDRTSSGRPVQLEDEEETSQPGRADAEPGLGDGQRGNRQDRRFAEDQPTKR